MRLILPQAWEFPFAANPVANGDPLQIYDLSGNGHTEGGKQFDIHLQREANHCNCRLYRQGGYVSTMMNEPHLPFFQHFVCVCVGGGGARASSAM